MENNQKIKNIIEALGKHEDESAVAVLEEIGTNNETDEIRELTAQALIRRNSTNALKVALASKGKGINDLSSRVAMSAISELLSLKDKTNAIEILENTIENDCEEDVKETARSVKTLIGFSC